MIHTHQKFLNWTQKIVSAGGYDTDAMTATKSLGIFPTVKVKFSNTTFFTTHRLRLGEYQRRESSSLESKPLCLPTSKFSNDKATLNGITLAYSTIIMNMGIIYDQDLSLTCSTKQTSRTCFFQHSFEKKKQNTHTLSKLYSKICPHICYFQTVQLLTIKLSH